MLRPHGAGQLRSGPGSRLDLVAFITTQRGTLVWARTGFGSRVPAAVAGSLCSQTTAQRGLCDAGVAGLNSSERYYLWVASGHAMPLATLRMPDAGRSATQLAVLRAVVWHLRGGCQHSNAGRHLLLPGLE